MPRGYFSDGYPIVPALFRYDSPLQFFDLDDDFDSSEDDYELVQAIVAGKVGLEPSARSNDHDPLSVEPVRYRRHELPVQHYNKVTHTGSAEPKQQYERVLTEAYDTTTVHYRPADWEPFAQYIRTDAEGRYIDWTEVTAEDQAAIDAYIERNYGPQR